MTQSAAAQADFRFVHFTDTHIMANGLYTPSTGEWQLDTTASLQRVIAVINALDPPPAFAIIGGDLTSPDMLQRGTVLTPEEYEPSYRLLQDLLGTLHCPAHMLMGNHDHRVAFHRVMQTSATSSEAPHYFSFDHQGYHFVGLDSHQPGEVWGHLDTTQLDWLRADLDTHQDQPTFVFVHHPPCAIGIRWMDGSSIRNGEALISLLQTYANVRLLVCGHVHLDQHLQRNGFSMVTTPATCFQISKLSQTRKTLPGPPGFRLIWVKGLEWSTRVIHLHGDSVAEL